MFPLNESRDSKSAHTQQGISSDAQQGNGLEAHILAPFSMGGPTRTGVRAERTAYTVRGFLSDVLQERVSEIVGWKDSHNAIFAIGPHRATVVAAAPTVWENLPLELCTCKDGLQPFAQKRRQRHANPIRIAFCLPFQINETQTMHEALHEAFILWHIGICKERAVGDGKGKLRLLM
jgi:hypothetical protein